MPMQASPREALGGSGKATRWGGCSESRLPLASGSFRQRGEHELKGAGT